MKIPTLLIVSALAVMMAGGLLKGYYPPSNEAQADDLRETKRVEALEKLDGITTNVEVLIRTVEAQRADLYAANQTVEDLTAWKDKIVTAAAENKKQEEKAEKKRRRAARASWGRIYSRPIVTEADEVAISRVSEVILYFMKKAPQRKLAKDETHRMELAADIHYTAKKAGVPDFLWALQTFRESSYRIDAKGSKGEIGMGQAHGKAADGCELETQFGQLTCTANWLAKCREKCESWEEALTMYASGHCRTSSTHLQKKVAERIRDWMDLEATY